MGTVHIKNDVREKDLLHQTNKRQGKSGMKSIFEMLKIISIEDDFIITSSFQRFSMWESEGVDCYFREAQRSGAYSAFVSELREGTTVEYFRVSRLSHPQIENRIRTESDIVLKQRLKHLNRAGIKNISNYFLISDDTPRRDSSQKEIDIQYHKNILSSFGTKIRRVGTEEIKKTLFQLISFEQNLQIHPDMTIREQLIQKQCVAQPENFKIGNTYLKTLSLKHLPESTKPFSLSFLLDYLLFDFVFSLSFTALPQSKEHVSLEAKERFFVATSGRGATKNAGETDELMTLLSETKHKIGFLSSKIIIWDSNPRELEKNAIELANILKNESCFYEEETWGHDLEYFKSLPSQMNQSQRQHRVISPNFIDMIADSTHGHGNWASLHPLFLRNRFGEIYGFDAGSPNRNNRNGSIFGASGSGKSVTVNVLIAHTFFPNIKLDKEHPGRIFIIDFAGAENSSYLKMADLYGGVFIPVDSKGKVVINPFPQRSKILKDGKWDTSLLNFLNIAMDLILEIREKSMNADLYRNIISRAIREMYQKIGNPVLSDLLQFIEDDDSEKVRTLRKLLQGFLDDPVSKIINGQSTIDYGNDPFVIYDLQGIGGINEKLRELLTFIVIQEAKRTAFEITNSFILFDEAAQLIKDPRLGDLIEELFATARKYNTGVWTITQNFLSFKETSLSSKIKINTTTTIFLSHANDEEAKRLVAQDFGFTDMERTAFNSLRTVKGEYALALFRTQIGDHEESEVVRIELSPFDYLVATSDKEDNRLLKKYSQARNFTLLDSCAESAAYARRNKMFAMDAVKKLLESVK